MAYLKAREVRGLKSDEREQRIKELRQELMHERGVSAMGGSPPSPGKIRQLRRQIARILTIQREDHLGVTQARAANRPKKTTQSPSKGPAKGTKAASAGRRAE